MLFIINGVKEDFKGRLEDLDKFYGETIEEITNTVEAVKLMARDSVARKEEELIE